MTLEDIKKSVEHILQYQDELKSLNTRYQTNDLKFSVSKPKDINFHSLQRTIRNKLKVDPNIAYEHTIQIFKELIIRDDESAYQYLHYWFQDSLIFKDKCLEILMNNKNIIFDLLKTYNTNLVNDYFYYCAFKFSSTELDLIWEKYGQEYIRTYDSTAVNFFVLFNIFNQHFSEEQKELLINRLIGYKQDGIINYMVNSYKNTHVLSDELINKLESYLLMLRLK